MTSALYRRVLSRAAYRILLAILVIAEYPLTTVAFQVFGQGRIETAAMALGVGIALVGSAHFVGLILRRHERVLDSASARIELIVGLGLATLLVVGVVALGVVRGAYLEAAQRELDLGVRIGSSTLISLAAIQLLIVVCAITGSYFSHSEAADEWERRKRSVRLVSVRRWLSERAQFRAERVFVAHQTKRDLVASTFPEHSLASVAWYDYLRFERRSANVRYHLDGPDPALLRAGLPPIKPGDWTTRQLNLYRLPSDEQTAGGHRPLHRLSGLRRRSRRGPGRES